MDVCVDAGLTCATVTAEPPSVFVVKILFLLASAGLCAAVGAQSQEAFTGEQISRGAQTFATFCSACHGERMSNPELFNLREFPKDQRSRFIESVSNGKNTMPPWRGQIAPGDIDALWAYVFTIEKD